MPLDFARLLPQIDLMSQYIGGRKTDRAQRLASAVSRLDMNEKQLENLRDRVAAAAASHSSTWLMAGILQGIGNRHAPGRCPPGFTVASSDGSHIDVDRHYSARCALINTSLVMLHYGTNPSAEISSWPELFFDDDSLTITAKGVNQAPQLIQGPLLGVKRAVEECRRLADGVEADCLTEPLLALLDGSLTLWSLAGKDVPPYVRQAMLDEGLLVQLDRLRACGQRRPLSVASFISFPRSTDVVNSLRVSFCPHERVDCDAHCPAGTERPCRVMDGLVDRDLFENKLAPGERSDIFASLSSIVTQHYGPHAVYFFYLRLEDELARVEFPAWVAASPRLVALTHSLLLDQCRRGLGYPAGLSESHEAAVLGGQERDQFWRTIEQTLETSGLPVRSSAKSQSKRLRSL
jgi:hypothetical protein